MSDDAADETDATAAPTPITADARREADERIRAQLPAVDGAIHVSRDLLQSIPPHERYNLRQDLRQELALKLVQGKLDVPGLRVAAKNWLLNHLRDRRRGREIEADCAAGTAKRYHAGEIWGPHWYEPCPGAEEHAPFALRGARVMTVKSDVRSHHDVEDALIGLIDARSKRRRAGQ